MSHILTQRRDRIGTITLNRPEKLNAFAGTMREDLLQILRNLAADSECRVVVITGAGRAFCAGGDVDFMRALQQRGDVDAFRKLLDAGGAIVTQIVEMPKPVIAAINGVAAGAGCNLALACDYRIAGDGARLGETFVRIGMHPDWGGTWLLPRLVGRSRAYEILATGRMVEGAEALQIGMIDRLVPADAFSEETQKLAESLAGGPPIALGDIKRALARSPSNDLRSQLDLESEHQRRTFLSADAGEGMTAFFEKRAPQFRGV